MLYEMRVSDASYRTGQAKAKHPSDPVERLRYLIGVGTNITDAGKSVHDFEEIMRVFDDLYELVETDAAFDDLPAAPPHVEKDREVWPMDGETNDERNGHAMKKGRGR